ncbi:MAG TPA: GNAT family protein [Chloroflexia bacterium]|nr:GNAT family protein [Chloroflexia bacterium]
MSQDSPTRSPILNVRGSKVGLGPFTQEYRQIYYMQYLQDPETAVHGSGNFRVISRVPEQQESNREVVFTVFELEGLTMIGESLLMEIDHQHQTASFGITIGNKDYWGKGYGSEASRLVLDYGFRFLNLYNISLITSSFNERAIRAYQKIGFKEIGRRRGAFLLGGQRYDDIYMDLLASDFEPPVPGWFSIQ